MIDLKAKRVAEFDEIDLGILDIIGSIDNMVSCIYLAGYVKIISPKSAPAFDMRIKKLVNSDMIRPVKNHGRLIGYRITKPGVKKRRSLCRRAAK